MQVTLFKALKSINISDEQATEVVAQLEEHMAKKIEEATKGLESQLKAQTWVIGTVGFILAIIGLAPTFAKLFA